MRNMIRSGKITISVVLVMLMAFLLPVQVFATTMPGQEQTETVTFDSLYETDYDASIVSEFTDRRDEYTKHFRMDDGTFMAVTYNSPVHFKNEKGKWVEYDNSLVAESEATPDEAVAETYTNKKSNIDIDIASDTKTNDLVNITYKKGNISWKYSGTNKSVAKIKNNNKKHKGNEKFTSIDKLTSQASYKGIYKDVDLDCIISTSGVKENIVLNSADAQNEFEIEYDIKGLNAKQIDDQTIELTNEKGKTVYTISAPYMYDANGNTSTDLTFKLLSNKSNKLKVKLTADKGFLKSWGRAYPVTIDPEVSLSGGINTETAYVTDTSPDTANRQQTSLLVGKSTYTGSLCRGLVRCKNIQENYSGKNIVSAKLNLFPTDPSSEMEIEAYPITSSWTNSTATYNSVKFGSEIIDYAKVESKSLDVVSFDITKYVRKWANGSIANNGIYLKSDDAHTSFGGYAYYFPAQRPTFVIKYKDYTGSESNLTSHTVSCGPNMQASVCDYTGSLTVRRDIYEENGEKLPYKIYATYHSSRKDIDEGAGLGWHMSFNKTLSLIDNYYIYSDADGVQHYFEVIAGETELYAEDESDYTLKINDKSIEITDDTIIQTFDVVSKGETSKIINEQCTDNSSIKVSYYYNGSGANKMISTIVTPINQYFFTYTSSSKYSRISAGNVFSNTYFSYSSNRISYISSTGSFASGENTIFSYSSTNNMTELYNMSGGNYGQKVTLSYNQDKVNKITQYDCNGDSSGFSEINYLKIDYNEGNSTAFTDKKTKKVTYIFDDYGNTVSILNKNGYLENIEDSGELSVVSGSDSYTKNYIDVSSEPTSIGSTSYFQKGNGTIGTQTSSGGTVTIDSTHAFLGSKSIKINHSGSSQIYTYAMHENSVDDLAGETVTLSAYVRTNNIIKGSLSGEKGAIIKFKCLDSSGSTLLDKNSAPIVQTLSGAEWQRLSLTVTIPNKTSSYRIYFGIRNAQGSAWFDCMQLEIGETMNDYNALSNSNFTSNINWKTQNGSSITLENGKAVLTGKGGGAPYSEESDDEDDEDDFPEDTEEPTVQITTENGTEVVNYDSLSTDDGKGNIIEEQEGKVINQIIKYKIHTSSSSQGSDDNGDSIFDDDTDTEIETKNCDNYIYQTVPINQRGICFNVSGTASANSVPLTVSDRSFAIGLRINYSDGTSEVHTKSFNYAYSGEQCVTESFTPNDTSKLVSTVDFAFLYGYNKGKMAVKNAMLNFASTSYDIDSINFSGIEDEDYEDDEDKTDESDYDYEIVSQKIDKTSPYMKTSREYDSSGNFLTKEIDSAGNSISYTYDKNGNNNKITDAKGNSTSYSYDEKSNISSISSGMSKTTYSYDGFYNLSSINHNGFSYNYSYDRYNNLTSTKIGNRSLVTNSYVTGTGLPLKTTYGNGAEYSYAYDDYGRTREVKLNGTTIAEYYYNKKGMLARCVDNKAGETTVYEYDFNGNLVYGYKETSIGTAGAYRSYYKSNGEFVKINNVYGLKQTVAMGTDKDGNEYVKNGSDTYVKVTKESDNFGRTTAIHEEKSYNGIDFKTSIGYVTGTGSDKYTTNLISSYTQTYNNSNTLADFSYKYDSNGNITNVYRNGQIYAVYTYDSLNRLTTEADRVKETYTFYYYDDGGNITQVRESELALNGWYPMSTKSITDYNYDSSWKDLLTKYGDSTITYDTIGNPLNYRNGMTMKWSGRDLNSITKDGKTYSYTYNIDGYRTKRVVGEKIYYYFYDDENKLIGMQVAEENSGFSQIYVFYYDSDGMVTSMQEGNSYYYFVKNAEGDIVAIADNHGNIRIKYTYDAWGKTTSVTDKDGKDASDNYYAKTIPFRYRGYVYDYESGLYYLNSRYYDPITGRFINADTYVDTYSGSPLSTNMFSYCEDNPVMGYDPEGYWDKNVHMSISARKAKNNKPSFAASKYNLARKITYVTDLEPLGSSTFYSTPFHSRGKNKSLEIAQYLFNLSMEINYSKNHEKRYFSFEKSSKKNSIKLKKILKYVKKGNFSNETKKAEKEFLKVLNLEHNSFSEKDKSIVLNLNNYNKPKYKKQASILLGLALHTFQDYYAHLVRVKAVSSSDLKNKKDWKKLFEWQPMTTFNSYFSNIGTKEMEDSDKVFGWRYTHTKTLTHTLAGFYQKNTPIALPTLKEESSNEKYTFNGVFNGTKKKITMKALKVKIVVKAQSKSS